MIELPCYEQLIQNDVGQYKKPLIISHYYMLHAYLQPACVYSYEHLYILTQTRLDSMCRLICKFTRKLCLISLGDCQCPATRPVCSSEGGNRSKASNSALNELNSVSSSFVCLFVRFWRKNYRTERHQTPREYKVGLQKCTP